MVGKPAKKKQKSVKTLLKEEKTTMTTTTMKKMENPEAPAVGSSSPPQEERAQLAKDGTLAAGKETKVVAAPRVSEITAGKSKSGKVPGKAKVSGYKRNAQSAPSRGVSLRELIKNGYLTPAEKVREREREQTLLFAPLP